MSTELKPVARKLWAPDASTNSCVSCDRLFTAFRRRHHCRFCGLLFCGSCCHTKVRWTDSESAARICKPCTAAIARSALSHSVSIAGLIETSGREEVASEAESSTEQNASSVAALQSIAREFDCLDISPQWTSAGHQDFSSSLQAFYQSHTPAFLSQAGLPQSWHRTLQSVTLDAVAGTNCTVRLRGDSMNPNRYIRIVKVDSSEKSWTKFVAGVAFYGQVLSLPLRTRVLSPSFVLLESAVASDPQNFLRRFLRLRCDILLSESSVPEATTSLLATYNVTVVASVQREVLELISRLARTRIFDSVEAIPDYRQNAAGKGVEFSFHHIKTNTLIVLKTDPGVRLGGSLLVSSEDEGDLKNVRMALRRLIVDYRSAELEAEMLQSFKCEPFPAIIAQQFASEAHFTYLSLGDFACMNPQTVDVRLYFDGDSPLGMKLLRFCRLAGEKCVCGCEFSRHTHAFLSKAGTVRFSTKEVMGKDGEFTESDTIFARVICRKCKEDVGRLEFSPLLWEYSFYKFLSVVSAPVTRTHRFHLCPGDVFRDYFYVFSIRNVELWMQFDPIETKTLIEPKTRERRAPDCVAEVRESRVQQELIEVKTAAESAVGRLRKECERVESELQTAIMNDDQSPLARCSREALRSDLLDAVSSLSSHLSALSLASISSFPALDSLRRSLFFSLSHTKTIYEQAVASLLSGKAMERSDSRLHSATMRQGSLSPRRSESSGDSAMFHSDTESGNRSETRTPCRFSHPCNSTPRQDFLYSSSDFLFLQRGALTLPMTSSNVCICVQEDDCLSLIAYGLSSPSYQESVASHIKSLPDDIQRLLLSPEAYHFSDAFSAYSEGDLSRCDNRTEMVKLYGQPFSFHVIAYFARQFCALQATFCAVSELIESLSRSEGKLQGLASSGAQFVTSFDGKFIAKIVGEKDFAMFLALAPNYFRHVYKSIYKRMPSLLVRTVGAYRVSVRKSRLGLKHVYWILLYENLTYGVPKPRTVFDLKGAINSRRRAKQGESRTKMDVDFLLEHSGMPVVLSPRCKRLLDAGVYNDSRFLSKLGVIDYSLLAVVTEKSEVVLGIIDYGQQYTLPKVVEKKVKTVVMQEETTIIGPIPYRDRFRDRISHRYFLSLSHNCEK